MQFCILESRQCLFDSISSNVVMVRFGGSCSECMTREARIMSGIILIIVPTIQYGGYFLLTSLMNKSSGYMDNPLRQNFFRAGHAHAGVIVILSLICQILADGPSFRALCFGQSESVCPSQRFSSRQDSSSRCCRRPRLKPAEPSL